MGSHAAGLKSNLKVLSYSHHNHGAIVPVGTHLASQDQQSFISLQSPFRFCICLLLSPLLFFPLNSYKEMFIPRVYPETPMCPGVLKEHWGMV